jgi:soluble epoxide hydrolase / lipid-phosphate phosphatase
MAAPDKLVPNDPRVKHLDATVRGKNYHYMLAEPKGTPVDTVLLVHGFPDLGMGWRYQVPFLVDQGLRVIVPDMIGYGKTDAPESIAEYGIKSICDDLIALVDQVGGTGKPFILGGHDWGGAVVWRLPLWYPERIRAVFSICTPYGGPLPQWIDLADIIALGRLTTFKYQLQFRGPDVESNVQGPVKIRQFLKGMYGGRGPNGEVAFTTEKGILFENLDKVGDPPLLNAEELDFYTERFSRTGMRGPLNWYRSRKVTFDEEAPLAAKGDIKLKLPALFVAASKDGALPPSMSAGMDKSFENLTRGEVDASHWALTQAPAAVNDYIKQWLDKSVFKNTAKASL